MKDPMFENIPQELKDTDRWLLWKLERNTDPDKKPDKKPYNLRTGRWCDPTDESNLYSFKRVQKAFQHNPGKYSGIGFSLSAELGIVGVDLDNVFTEKQKLKPWAKKIIKALPDNTYTEISPSQTGLRLFLLGKKPGNLCKKNLPDDGKIELYEDGRYLTVTGNAFGNGEEIPEAQDALNYIYTEFFEESETPIPVSDCLEGTIEDNELLDKMFSSKNGANIYALWKGDTSDYLDDDSAADQALLCYLAFWTRKNPAQMERLFGESELANRPKWQNRKDYRDSSIQKAIKTCNKVYFAGEKWIETDGVLNSVELEKITKRIKLIPADTPRKELPIVLNPVLHELSQIDEAQAFSILDIDIKRYFGLSKEELRLYQKKIKVLRKQHNSDSKPLSSAFELLNQAITTPSAPLIHPAQDFYGSLFTMGVNLDKELLLVTSDRTLERPSELDVKLKTSELEYSHFSAKGVKHFLNGKNENGERLFNDIKAYIDRFISFTDEKYLDLLAIWIMGTYMFCIFQHYPYIWVNAEKGSGKTTLFEVIEPIVFNGQMVASITPSVLFREISESKVTLLIDEAERMTKNDKEANSALIGILNSGYQRNGRAKRMEKNEKGQFTPKSYDTYAPKMLSGINSIDDVLRDRTILVQMLRKSVEEYRERYKKHGLEKLHSKLRDRCFIYALSHANEIFEIYQSDIVIDEWLPHLANRELDLWQPLFSILYQFDIRGIIGLSAPLISLSRNAYKDKLQDDIDENDTSQLISALLRLLNSDIDYKEMKNDVRAYRALDVAGFLEKDSDYDSNFVETKEVTKKLRKLGIEAGQKRFKADEKVWAYVIPESHVSDLGKRYNIKPE